MTKEEFNNYKKELLENGYKIYKQSALKLEDYLLAKSFHTEDNKFEDGRSCYQILIYIYDWDLHPELISYVPDKVFNSIGVEIAVSISRTTDESIELSIPFVKDKSVDNIEKIAEKFYNWAIEIWPNP